jgi:Transcriptional regulator, AbiEi antitoxin
MNDADRSIARLAEAQRNVFTRQQALSAGLSRSGLQRRVAAGLLVPVGTKSYRFAGAELDWRGHLLGGLFDLGMAALVTGRSAAALHGLDGFAEGPVELLVPRARRSRLASGRVSSTMEIGPLDRVVVDGLRVTSATRTIVELAGRVSERELGNAIDSACRLGLTSPVVLRRRLDGLGRQGRPGVAAFDRVMESAGVQSWLEREFEHLIRSAALPMPHRQRVYRRDGRHVARVDFDFEPWPVVAEVGGRRGYLSADDRRRQEHRRNELQLIGKVVYFFTTEDVVETPGYVISTLRAALVAAA